MQIKSKGERDNTKGCKGWGQRDAKGAKGAND